MTTIDPDWPFDDPPNVAVFMTRQIVRGEHIVDHVAHDRLRTVEGSLEVDRHDAIPARLGDGLERLEAHVAAAGGQAAG